MSFDILSKAITQTASLWPAQQICIFPSWIVLTFVMNYDGIGIGQFICGLIAHMGLRVALLSPQLHLLQSYCRFFLFMDAHTVGYFNIIWQVDRSSKLFNSANLSKFPWGIFLVWGLPLTSCPFVFIFEGF